jgi:hypothetical protein
VLSDEACPLHAIIHAERTCAGAQGVALWVVAAATPDDEGSNLWQLRQGLEEEIDTLPVVELPGVDETGRARFARRREARGVDGIVDRRDRRLEAPLIANRLGERRRDAHDARGSPGDVARPFVERVELEKDGSVPGGQGRPGESDVARVEDEMMARFAARPAHAPTSGEALNTLVVAR